MKEKLLRQNEAIEDNKKANQNISEYTIWKDDPIILEHRNCGNKSFAMGKSTDPVDYYIWKYVCMPYIEVLKTKLRVVRWAREDNSDFLDG